MFALKISAKFPLSPEGAMLGICCRPRTILRNATSFVIRSIPPKWSSTSSYASNLRCPAPGLSNGTKLPRMLSNGTYGHPSYISSFFTKRLQKKKYKKIQLFSPLIRAKYKQRVINGITMQID
jgi:hypothetical protein